MPDTTFHHNTGETNPTMRFDDRWLTSLKAMESEAWDMLLRLYADDLRRGIQASLVRRGMSPSLVDDIEQETWLTAVRKIGEFQWQDDEKLFHWLRAISLKHVFTYERKRSDELSMDDTSDADEDASLERFYNLHSMTSGSIEDEVIRRDQLIAVDGAMRTLKPREQEILLRWLMGEKPRDLAQFYHLKPRSVSMVLLRAKEKIEANLLLGLLKNKDDHDV
jgi:RNA polymerase sigma factor (sigma-70 family)